MTTPKIPPIDFVPKYSAVMVGISGELQAGGRLPIETITDESGRVGSALWRHVDRNGHVQRYLSWNDWLFYPKRMWEMAVRIPLPPGEESPLH